MEFTIKLNDDTRSLILALRDGAPLWENAEDEPYFTFNKQGVLLFTWSEEEWVEFAIAKTLDNHKVTLWTH